MISINISSSNGGEQMDLAKRRPHKFSWRSHQMERWIFKDLFQTVCWSERRILVCSQIPLPSQLTFGALRSFLVSTVFSPTTRPAQWICPKIAAFYKWAGQLFCFGFLCTGIWVISSSSTAQAPHFRAGGRQLFFSAYCLSILWPVSTSQGMLGPQWQVHQIKMKVSLNWFPPNSLTKLNFERMPLGGLFDSWASNRLEKNI